jgi:hypothetical protein
MHETFAAHTVKSLQTVAVRIGGFQWSETKNRRALYNCIEQAESAVQQAISEAMSKESVAGRTKYNRRNQSKRPYTEDNETSSNPSRKRRKLNASVSSASSSSDSAPSSDFSTSATPDSQAHVSASASVFANYTTASDSQSYANSNERFQIEQLLESDFMRAPSDEVIANSMARYIDATNNAAVNMCACACCAREWNCENVYRFKFSDIPNKDHLRPAIPHPKHDLFEGLLLYPPAIEPGGIAVICNECRVQLKNNRLPKFALANGMWIGEVPPELSNLTLPERMLIAKYFPAAYIVKLFPKKGSGGWKRSQLHNGLRGNVSTYILDPKQVASMVEGPKMPPPSTILSATIGITFIGPTGLQESTMPAMFRVRRERVRKALIWLKENNTLYSDIQISESRLCSLPVDGVPEELIRSAKFSSDVDAVYAEHDSYVPDQEESEDGAPTL